MTISIHRLCEWHASQHIKDLEDGEIELGLKLNNLTEIRRWILSWGEHAVVIAPDALRIQIQRSGEKMIEKTMADELLQCLDRHDKNDDD